MGPQTGVCGDGARVFLRDFAMFCTCLRVVLIGVYMRLFETQGKSLFTSSSWPGARACGVASGSMEVRAQGTARMCVHRFVKHYSVVKIHSICPGHGSLQARQQVWTSLFRRCRCELTCCVVASVTTIVVVSSSFSRCPRLSGIIAILPPWGCFVHRKRNIQMSFVESICACQLCVPTLRANGHLGYTSSVRK